ncbi:hypothetical protein [Pannonibacter tanglangensis]|uniref:HD domain-containing protein n=1 Tax=Pannonibacter tanglangensis TaxID=2750084 RepID=A0ABW9ZDG5_9HYPH|nr:hypothetical protein [Pannonibacter sp. XCT-34]NBN62068.1 hypothetical protein [Pannonibacter sp. XCT-34]
MATVARAVKWAYLAFAGERDKAGRYMIDHMSRVAERVKTPNEKMVAWLHDVVEDERYSLEELAADGFSRNVIAAVDAITKRDGEGYDEYLDRVAANRLARTVKLADLADNSDEARLALLPAETADRLRAKYAKAIARLAATGE